ncbi:MAG: Asp-tRNA(Asn)/Glu-tRNA(Gln) amidotransferase subunit GatA [Patescibacteria group bacterium]
MTLIEMRDGLAKKEFSSRELTDALLDAVEKKNPELNAFLAMNQDARAEADASDARRREGSERSALDGVPYAAKDMFLTTGIVTTAGSKMLEGYVPAENATAVQRLEDAGAILLGKNNCDEFAMGASGEYSAYGATKNPRDITRVPGGSSSGSAAAVAAGLAPLSLGTDTNGSIRQPAAFCGVVGLKPTYGRISRYGTVSLMSSADHMGTFTHTPEDAAVALQILAGQDPRDATTSREQVPDYEKEIKQLDLKKITVGLPKEYFGEGLDPAIAEQVRSAAKKLEQLGAKVVELSLPHTLDALPTYYILNPAEASSNLARYDGIRYSKGRIASIPEGMTLRERYAHVRGEGFGKEPKRRIMIGNYVLSAEHQDATFRHASKVRTLIHQDFNHAFEQVDVLFTPVAPSTAFLLGAVQDPVQMYLADIFTSAPALAGVPAVSVPVGEIDGLPVGLQIVGKSFAEGQLLGVAAHVMHETRT